MYRNCHNDNFFNGYGSVRAVKSAAQTSVFENNIYAVWFTNKSGNWEVMFRASGDAGKTFGDKINLSNSPTSDSVDVDISSDESNVAVSWWERN